MPADENRLTHLDESGAAHMVDVADKAESTRIADARAFVSMKPETLALLKEGNNPKGDAIASARIAAIMAAKRTPELIPLCHPIAITRASAEFELVSAEERTGVEITTTCECVGRTGVEMEALTAASVAALTIYDMCKAVDRGMKIETSLLSKSGGRSGTWTAEEGS